MIVKEEVYLVWIESKKGKDFYFYIPVKEFSEAVAVTNIILDILIKENKDDTLKITNLTKQGTEMWSLTESEVSNLNN